MKPPACSSDIAACTCAAAVDTVDAADGTADGAAGGGGDRNSVGDDRDAALALQLQLEAEGWSAGGPPACAGSACAADDDASAALAAMLEEEELAKGGSLLASPELLQAQFQEYEDKMTREDAEEWHGHGDLMQRGLARDTLTLENMDKVTCYSIGHGRLREKDFYELLSLNSIRTLYDFRRSDHRGDVHAPCQQYSVRALKATCKARGIKYKHIALGRESAYGILPHIGSDEARHALIELVWHAKRGRTAFLGFDEDWRQDHRQVVAEELAKAGHAVKHVDSAGATEDHELGHTFPDFIVQEEEKLRKLEKMRQAGELKRPEKSAVDRSTEAIASRLDRPAQEVDAMDELTAASNQRELVQAQSQPAKEFKRVITRRRRQGRRRSPRPLRNWWSSAPHVPRSPPGEFSESMTACAQGARGGTCRCRVRQSCLQRSCSRPHRASAQHPPRSQRQRLYRRRHLRRRWLGTMDPIRRRWLRCRQCLRSQGVSREAPNQRRWLRRHRSCPPHC